MALRIENVNSAPKDRYGVTARGKRGGRAHAVDSECHPTDNHGIGLRKLVGYFIRRAFSVFTHFARSDDTDAKTTVEARERTDTVE